MIIMIPLLNQAENFLCHRHSYNLLSRHVRQNKDQIYFSGLKLHGKEMINSNLFIYINIYQNKNEKTSYLYELLACSKHTSIRSLCCILRSATTMSSNVRKLSSAAENLVVV